jgi:1,4-alpha-glucan branching enzyme
MIEVRFNSDGYAVVTFRVPNVDHPDVNVVGEFNRWSPTALPMDKDADGDLMATVTLQVGRRYRFRYLVDGSRWENDWAADDYAPNEFGGDDSVIDLTEHGPRRPVKSA